MFFKRMKWRIAGLIIGIIALIILFIVRFSIVNNRWKEPPVFEYNLGETVNNHGIDYTFSNFHFYTKDELCKAYPEVDPSIFDIGNDFQGKPIQSVFVLVDVYCKNTSDKNVVVNFFEKMQLQVADNLITCFDPYDLFPILNPNKPLAGMMLPGHDILLTLPFQLISTGFSAQEWENLSAQTSYKIFFSIWPEQVYINLKSGPST